MMITTTLSRWQSTLIFQGCQYSSTRGLSCKILIQCQPACNPTTAAPSSTFKTRMMCNLYFSRSLVMWFRDNYPRFPGPTYLNNSLRGVDDQLVTPTPLSSTPNSSTDPLVSHPMQIYWNKIHDYAYFRQFYNNIIRALPYIYSDDTRNPPIRVPRSLFV